ncbi:MAG: calcium-binding protein, partial [Pseudomonadota bacterium]
MARFYEVNVAPNDVRAGWQKHHVVPTQERGLDDLADLFDAIDDATLPLGLRYDQNLFDFNGFLLPYTIEDSLAFGFAHHRGSHSAFSVFVKDILEEIQSELTADSLTVEQAARTVRGFQAYLIDKLTVDAYQNLLTGELIVRPGFFLNYATPWLQTINGDRPTQVAAIYGGITLDHIRNHTKQPDADDNQLPFWQGYNSDSGSYDFDAFDYAERSGTIYDPYFSYAEGTYASSIERFLARRRGVDLAEVTDFVTWKLGDLLSNQFSSSVVSHITGNSDVYRPNAVVLDDVVFFQEDADHAQTIADLTVRIEQGLGISASDRPDALLINGAIGPFEADLVILPHEGGSGVYVSSPTERSILEFANLTDELLDKFDGIPFDNLIRGGLDKLQSSGARWAAKILGIDLNAIKTPHLTVAIDEIDGLGHSGTDLSIGVGSAAVFGQGGNDWLGHVGYGSAHGGVGDDNLFGITVETGPAGEVLSLHGDEGDDNIFLLSGAGGRAYGGLGDDVLVAGGANSHLYGEEGEDQFYIGAGTVINDAEPGETVFFAGINLHGGTKQWWMEGGVARWAPFSTLLNAFPTVGSSLLSAAAAFVDSTTMKFASYKKIGDDLLVDIGYGLGGSARIVDYLLDLDSGLASGGVVAFAATRAGDASSNDGESSFDGFAQFINLALKAGFGVGFTGWDPIVLDLDGDGYELTTQRNSGVHFEFDGDGFAEKTGWVRPDDGFLVLDANGNGIVDDSSEFFGDETQGGFVELASHDLNADGIIDASDAIFSQLQVWRDANSDGVTDNGELVTLTDLGIVSISVLGLAPAEPIDIGGNAIAAEAAFTFADGTIGMAGDVVLDISHIDTEYITSTTVSAAAEALPQLRGFGNVADLRMAMSENAALLAKVQAFDQLATNDLAALKQSAEDILYAWAGVDIVAADPIGGSGFDARKLAFLEAFSGQEIAPRDPVTGAVSTAGLAELEASWADTLENLTLRLVIQSSALPAFADMTYRENIDTIVMGGADTLKQAYEAILNGLSADPVTALAEWEAWSELLRAVQDGSRRFDNNTVRSDFVAAQLQAAIISTGTSFDLAMLAPALGIDNLTISTSAAETLDQNGGGTIFSGLGDGDTARGRTGQDVYLIESGFGTIAIDDVEAGQSGDRIRFIDLNKADVAAARVGADLVLTVTATGETVTVLGQFADVVPLSSDVIISNNRGIEEIQFADGVVMELPDIAIAVGEGTSGDDVMHGTMHTDVFQGREGNDLLMGGDDADLYVFDSGDGADLIRDVQTTTLLKAADMIILGDDIAPEDIVFSRGSDANDLVITIGDAGDSITVDNQFGYTSLGYNAQFAPNSRIEVLSFRHYGDVYTNKDIQQELIASETTDGDDVTRGFGDDDTFGPSAGDDTLIGLDGNDTYLFGRGFGNDTIDEQAIYIDVNVGLGGLSLEHGADTVRFAPDIELDDVTFSRESAAPHLLITLDTGETLTVRNQFDGFQTGPLGNQWLNRVEWFEFGDSTRLSWQDVLLETTTGGDGDDSLWGDLYQDTLAGGLGNDYLSGGGYADTYLFNLGDGQDILDDNNEFILGSGFVTVDTTPDTLRLGSGITAADVALGRNGNDLTLTIGTDGDVVTLRNQNAYFHTGVFGAISYSRIERVEFDDGEVWSWQQLNQFAIEAQTTAGDDIISGFALADRFEASAGNDIMRGGDSGDTYVFGIGSGQDRIEETVSNQNFDDDDVVEFGAGIARSDLSFDRVNDDLIISIDGTSDTLTIAGQFENYVGFTDNDVETFRFDDGSILTKAEIKSEMTTGTSGDDTIFGFHTSDTIIGGAGNDMLYGHDGSDRYIFNMGDGQDTIFETVEYANIADNDRIIFGAGIAPEDISLSRSGNALTLAVDGTTDSITVNGQFAFASWFSWHDVEFFEFADGTVWTKRDVSNFLTGGTTGDDVLVGTFENDELDGLAGHDILRGGDGSDIYYFGAGYGQDRIEETITNANLDDYDQVVFGDGITASDLTFTRDGDALTISITGGADTLTIAGQFDNYIGYTNFDIERLQFSDGSVMTKAEIQAILTVGTAADETIVGFHTSDRIDGGAGNDILRGLDGSDTYLFGRGSGNDIIRESVEYVNFSDADRIEFAADLTLQDITWSSTGTSLVIGIVDTADTITVEGGFDDEGNTGYTWRDVELFDFADGTTLTKAEVRVLALAPTDGDDTIEGFYTADTITGGAGNDVLRGKRGNDTYIFALGDDQDTIEDGYGVSSGLGGTDKLVFDAGISLSDLEVTQQNNSDILIAIAGTSDSVLLKAALTDVDNRIESFEFADGTILTHADMVGLSASPDPADNIYYGSSSSETLSGGGGNDTLYGQEGNDTLIGGEDNDLLRGRWGNDTYVFNIGDGQDTIEDGWGVGTTAGTDRVLFGEGITTENIVVTQPNSADILISIAGTTDSVLLKKTLSDNQDRIESVEFADGTVLSYADVVALSVAATAGDDVLYGSSSSDTIAGGAGNDTLYGQEGNDTLIGGADNDLLRGRWGNDVYLFDIGDGQDTIEDGWSVGTTGGTDKVVFGAGITAADLIVTQPNSSDLLISIAGTTDSVRLKKTLSDYHDRIESVEFADGTVLSHAELVTLANTPTDGDDLFYGSYSSETLSGGAGNDTLYGQDGNDVLIGGPGNDVLYGRWGNDTFIFNLGDGQDTIEDGLSVGSSGGTDKLLFGAGIAVTDIVVRQPNDDDLLITITGTSDSVRLKKTITDWHDRIETVEFDDGTVLNHSDLMALSRVPTDGDDEIRGDGSANTLTGALGNDTLTAKGGDDSLSGNGGDDTLLGGGGNDVYHYYSGDGDDEIIDNAGQGTADTLRLHGIDASRVTFEDSPGGARFEIHIAESSAGAGDGGTITLPGVFAVSDDRGVDLIEFDDGTLLTKTDIDALAVNPASNDIINGTNSSETLDGGQGDDTVTGNRGNDVFIYTRGDGNDRFNEYRYHDWDRVVLHNIDPASVTLRRESGNNVTLVIAESAPGAGDGGEIYLHGGHTGSLVNSQETGFERIDFDDGTQWTPAIMRSMVLDDRATDGDDTFNGFDNSDALEGGLGNDTIGGRRGNDVYTYTRGDGNDRFNDYRYED